MDWLSELLFGTGVAHVVFVLALTIAIGVSLGRIRIAGISLGSTWILFAGITFSHFGLVIQPDVNAFIKQFGLILFIFSIGLQVGPGFFASLRRGGLEKNLFMLLFVSLGILTAYTASVLTGTPITTMVGVMSGAVVSTPSLGAAEQTFFEMTGASDPSMAQGYAVAYPFAVVSSVLFLSLMKYLMHIDPEKEKQRMLAANTDVHEAVEHLSVIVENSSLEGLTIGEIARRISCRFVVSRIRYIDGTILSVSNATKVHVGDRLYILTNETSAEDVVSAIGSLIPMSGKEWGHSGGNAVSRSVTVTRREIQGKTIGQLKLRNFYDVNVTRVSRAGVYLLATPDLKLQMGDILKIVGSENSLIDVAKFFGNSNDKLLVPNIIPIFIGIFLGVFLGSMPIAFPMMPQPVKLGLAGGPMIVAILLGRYGPSLGIVTYTTKSANMMLREIGLSMFMAAVGLSSGQGFVSSLLSGGSVWIFCALVITLLPALVTAFVIRYIFKKDFYTMSGIIAGSFTAPVMLDYANQQASSDIPSVNYATVYPLATFLRILAAQVMILLLL